MNVEETLLCVFANLREQLRRPEAYGTVLYWIWKWYHWRRAAHCLVPCCPRSNRLTSHTSKAFFSDQWRKKGDRWRDGTSDWYSSWRATDWNETLLLTVWEYLITVSWMRPTLMWDVLPSLSDVIRNMRQLPHYPTWVFACCGGWS